jgi:molybdopterin molybdotransferase
MKSAAEALHDIMVHVTPLKSETRALQHVAGAVLYETLFARFDLPGFNNSAMDGYAVRAEDARVGAWLTVTGESRAGGRADVRVEASTAVRIFTGAQVPEGADSVVMQENVSRDGNTVCVEHAVSHGANVRKRGGDMRAGTCMLEAGTRLGAGEIALLAAQGYAQLNVYAAPRVAVVTTGDELCGIEDAGQPGRVVNSNAYLLSALIASAGCVPVVLPAARDDLDAIQHSLRVAEAQADVIITCGGVSVGDHDLVAPALAAAGFTTHFAKVAIKPGKPVLFATRQSRPLFGLPGNPVSAMVTFEAFVRPALRAMQGDRAPYPRTATVQLAEAIEHSLGRLELTRAQLRHERSAWIAVPHALQGSGSLPSMVGVDALVCLDGRVARFEREAWVPALLLDCSGGSVKPPFD